ncbi:hypothetical protein ACE15N_21265 [Xanthomonas campestris pv. passiflorae]|uniref:hypothetical protein n=1 Tax=Xanthomonas campestris TaxID=339 RepID=UPI0024215B9F|nr:hypothetical protein [Xanthomonas campestris]MBV6814686.1 hypothetical protein [Xanthomonas campestris pv. passiflorae]
MFDDAKPKLQEILELVNLCPENLQEKCFELLLSAYLDSKATKAPVFLPASQQILSTQVGEINQENNSGSNGVPELIKTRFNSLVSRTKVSAAKAVELFDFNVDPFTYHGVSVPGSSNREKMRNVALLLALKSYLISANWDADWKEFRVMCMDHNCWDQGNVFSAMKHEWFKKASSSEGIVLSPSGRTAADTIFAKLSGGEDSQSA